MKALKVISGLLAVFVGVPIGLYLQYQVLKRVNATELMFFLYWVNIPVLIFVQFASKLLEKAGD